MKRLHAVQQAVGGHRQVGALLISEPANIAYLTGFPGADSALLVTETRAYFMTDKRYADDAAAFFRRKSGVQVLVTTHRENRFDLCKKKLRRHRIRRLGFEKTSLSYYTYEKLAAAVGRRCLVGCTHFVERFRMYKDPGEIALIEQAIAVNEKVLRAVKQWIPQVRDERMLAQRALDRMQRLGASGPSFDPIVAAGTKSAIPHARTGTDPIRKQAAVLVDMGACYEEYCSDLTRTFFWGRMTGFFKKVYDNVLEAQEIAFSLLGPGTAAKTVDAAVRRYFKKQGCLQHFTHALGHGVGRVVHELPSLSAVSTEVLMPGMVLTIEPGLYYPGEGGVRIEDMVLITENGYRRLSRYSRERDDMRIL